MLTAAKNQWKVILLSVKYNIMREMTNQVTFLTNVSFMVLNNATFIIQWMLLFSLKKDIGGYNLNDVLLLWGIAAGTFGLSHIFFQKAYELSDLIVNGKLDSFLVQPKNVLLSVISSGTNSSAIGDVLYGYLIIIIFKFSIYNLILFTIFSILGALILTAFAVINGSLSFWIVKGDMISGNLNNIVLSFSTYPEGIFKGVVRLILYTLIPVGFINYLPIQIMLHFHLIHFLVVFGFTAFIIFLAFVVFYKGLKRYTSSSLMGARI
jgi:ABC-2 type transport system permease protein